MNSIKRKLGKIVNLTKWRANRENERNANMIITLEIQQAEVSKLSSENQEYLEYMAIHINLIENQGLQRCIHYTLTKQQEIINRHEEIHRELRQEILDSIKQREEDEEHTSTKMENTIKGK